MAKRRPSKTTKQVIQAKNDNAKASSRLLSRVSVAMYFTTWALTDLLSVVVVAFGLHAVQPDLPWWLVVPAISSLVLLRRWIENRLTSYPGHVFNEVKLDGRWYVLDSMINIFVEASWEDIFRHPHERDSIVVLLFPSQSSHDDRSKRYRSITPQFRLMTLLRIANQADPFGKTSHTDLPGFFE